MSSEKVLSGGRPSFSQTCSLLSLYLKGRGGFGGLSLGLTPNSAAERRGTMDLLPKIGESGRTDGGDLRASTETGQLTIFYAGQVMVFNDCPAQKAEEIMSLARANSSPTFPPPSPAESATGTPARVHSSVLADDLPLTRKRSLARFLEKRKHRVAANAPYQANKPAKREPWLGLAQQHPSD